MVNNISNDPSLDPNNPLNPLNVDAANAQEQLLQEIYYQQQQTQQIIVEDQEKRRVNSSDQVDQSKYVQPLPPVDATVQPPSVVDNTDPVHPTASLRALRSIGK